MNIIKEDLENIYNNKNVEWGKFKDTTVMVTGPYGMLMSYVVYMLIFLNHKGYNIKIISVGKNLQKFNERFAEFTESPNMFLIESDLSKPIQWDEKIDYIIHGASLASSQYYGSNPVDVIMPNTVGTYHTLELARRNNLKGYLFISSGEVYGIMQSKPIGEEYSGYLNPTDVRNCYSESKRLGENLCIAYLTQYGVPTKIVRLAHTYGPTMNIQTDKRVFSEFVLNIVMNQNIVMKSQGNAVRTFCYISDMVVGLFITLEKGKNGNAYNICNNRERMSIAQLAQLLIEMYPEKNLKVEIQIREENEEYLQNPNDLCPIIKSDKLCNLGMEYKISAKEGFKRTIESFMIAK